MDEKMLKYEFLHTDEYGSTTKYSQEITANTSTLSTPFEEIVNQFKCFLLALSYSPNLVDKIQIVENDE